MLEGGKISGRQLASLLVIQVVGTVFLFLPSFVVQEAGRDAWLTPFLSVGYGFLHGILLAALVRRFRGYTVTGFCATQKGGFWCWIVGLLLILFYIYLAAIVLREFGDFFKITIMPETPLIVFGAVVVALSAFTVRGGIEVLGRLAEFLLPFILFSVLFVFLLAVGNMSASQFFPFLENGLVPVLKGSLPLLGWYSELAVLLFLAPFVTRPEDAPRCFTWAVVVISIFLLLVVVGPVAVFGAEVTKKLTFPSYSLARIIDLAEFINRVEIVVVLLWVAGVFIKLGILHYVLALGGAELLNLKDYRPLVLPLGLLLGSLSVLIFDNTLELVEFLRKTWPFYSLTFQLLLPAVFFIFPRKGGGNG